MKIGGGCDRRVLRRIFGSKRDKQTAPCRNFHIEEFHDLSASPNIIQMMRWVEYVTRMGQNTNAYVVLCGETSRTHTTWKT
jgi:hypothetical protein